MATKIWKIIPIYICFDITKWFLKKGKIFPNFVAFSQYPNFERVERIYIF